MIYAVAGGCVLQPPGLTVSRNDRMAKRIRLPDPVRNGKKFYEKKKEFFMYKIVRKRELNPTVTQMEIEAPLVARKAKPGQFIILRVDEEGERIPLTVAGTNPEEGTVKIIFQIVGATTELLNHKNEGEYIQDFVGPLGKASET